MICRVLSDRQLEFTTVNDAEQSNQKIITGVGDLTKFNWDSLSGPYRVTNQSPDWMSIPGSNPMTGYYLVVHPQTKKSEIPYFMRMAEQVAGMSSAIRRKVGALAVKNGQVISMGYNGTLPGDTNICELEDIHGSLGEIPTERIRFDRNNRPVEYLGVYAIVTKPEVVHAEKNLIAKLAQSTQSSQDCSVFVTLSPCVECATLMIMSGVSEVFYREQYRDTAGLELLKKNKINCWQVEYNDNLVLF